jgi:D-alanyl-D-alanine carboxypeptidase
MCALLLTVAMVPAVGQSVPSPVGVPDGWAARQLARWLEVFNAGDRATWERFARDHYPSQPSPDPDLAFREQTGGLDLVRFEESTSTRATAVVKVRDSESTGARVVVEVQADEPHQIVRVAVQPGVALPSTVAPLAESELPGAVRAEIDRRVAADRFTGAVLIMKGARRVFAGAAGLADRTRAIPNRLDTRFRNGSMNKMFTAVAVLSLVQAGKLSLQDPIGKHLPDLPNAAQAANVTVHHLLTHTGGTGDFFGPDFFEHRLELRTHQDYVRRYGARDPLFEPGSRWMYSNYGFILLGAVIERVSGQSYYDYVRAHVYAPAGMTSTGSEPEDRAVERRSIGYMRRPGIGWQSNDPTLPYRGTAAGGGYTTVEDLARFAAALTSHRLLSAHYTQLLTAGQVEAPDGRYAYGFIEQRLGGMPSIGHGGNAPGMDGAFLIFPASGYVVAVLANLDAPAAQHVAEFIANRLPR